MTGNLSARSVGIGAADEPSIPHPITEGSAMTAVGPDALDEIATTVAVLRKGAVRRTSKRGVIVDIDATEAAMARAGDLLEAVTKALAGQVSEPCENPYYDQPAAFRLASAEPDRAEGGEREIIARIIDPETWAGLDRALADGLWADGGTAVREAHRPYLKPSLCTADAILAVQGRGQ